MSGIKDKDDGKDWTIKVQPGKGELIHDTNSEDCWCMPDVVQPCRRCNTQWYEDANVDDITDHPDKVPALQVFRALANEDCPVCRGTGLEPKYDKDESSIIVHR